MILQFLGIFRDNFKSKSRIGAKIIKKIQYILDFKIQESNCIFGQKLDFLHTVLQFLVLCSTLATFSSTAH